MPGVRLSPLDVFVATLITALSHTTIWVLDQDEALEFYTQKKEHLQRHAVRQG